MYHKLLSIGIGTWLLWTIAKAVAILVQELNNISDPFLNLKDIATWRACSTDVVEAYLQPMYLAKLNSNFFLSPKLPEISPLFKVDKTDFLSFWNKWCKYWYI